MKNKRQNVVKRLVTTLVVVCVMVAFSSQATLWGIEPAEFDMIADIISQLLERLGDSIERVHRSMAQMDFSYEVKLIFDAHAQRVLKEHKKLKENKASQPEKVAERKAAVARLEEWIRRTHKEAYDAWEDMSTAAAQRKELKDLGQDETFNNELKAAKELLAKVLAELEILADKRKTNPSNEKGMPTPYMNSLVIQYMDIQKLLCEAMDHLDKAYEKMKEELKEK